MEMNLDLIKESMTSMDLANVIGKRHSNLLRDIREMENAWEKVNGLKFELVEYVDSKGEKRPVFNLKKPELLFIISKYNDELRAKIIKRLYELELEHKRIVQSQLDYFWDKEDQNDLYNRRD